MDSTVSWIDYELKGVSHIHTMSRNARRVSEVSEDSECWRDERHWSPVIRQALVCGTAALRKALSCLFDLSPPVRLLELLSHPQGIWDPRMDLGGVQLEFRVSSTSVVLLSAQDTKAIRSLCCRACESANGPDACPCWASYPVKELPHTIPNLASGQCIPGYH